jgi:hypothetical protein
MLGELLQVRKHIVADPAAKQEASLGGIDDIVEDRSQPGCDGASGHLLVRLEQRDGPVAGWLRPGASFTLVQNDNATFKQGCR